MGAMKAHYEALARETGIPREEPWFNFTQPWEKTTRGWGHHRALKRWRQRHERIFKLEMELGYIDAGWSRREVFPWVGPDYYYDY